MTKAEYNKTVNRAMAAAFLQDAGQAMDAFRPVAEMAGLRVNGRCAEIKARMDEFSREIYWASMDQQRELP